MTRRENQVIAYLTDSEKSQLSRYVDNSEKTQSEIIRQAILEYLDHDRAARVESEVRDLQGKIDEVLAMVSDGDAHTHKPQPPMNQGSTAVEKARKIVTRLQANHDQVIQGSDVERAIEDIAGADDRTIRKYKHLFRKRALLFEHPGETAVWTTESEQWFTWITDYGNLNGVEEARKKADEYPAMVTIGTDDKLRIELMEGKA